MSGRAHPTHRPPWQTRTHRLVVAGVLLATVACTSTTREGAEPALGVRAENATSVGAPIVGERAREESDGLTIEGASADPSAPAVSSAGVTSRSGARQPGSGEPGAAAGAGGELSIGFEVDADNSSAYSAIGAAGVSSGNQTQMVRALVDWINSSGGIAGLTVAPVIHESNVQTSSFAAQAQSACADFTEDHQVFAVVGRTSDRDDLYRCLAPKGVPIVVQNRYLWDRQTIDDGAGLLYVPGGLSGGRWDAWVRGLGAEGYFLPTGAYGVLRFDTPGYARTYSEVVEPAIRREGVTVAEEVVVHQPEAVANFGSMNAELGNAVLRLRAANIDHVMILDEGTMSFFFMPAAESQGFRPRYGLHSQNIPQVLAANVPAAQLSGSIGAGWVPTLDVDFEQDPEDQPAAAQCRAVYEQAGIVFPDRAAESFAMRYCDSITFLRDALALAPALDVRGLRAGVDSLGSGHASALTFRASFAPGKYDGADDLRPFAFDDACACFDYGR